MKTPSSGKVQSQHLRLSAWLSVTGASDRLLLSLTSKSWGVHDLYPVLPLIGLFKWLRGKGSACQAEDVGSIPGSGRSPGEGNDNPLQYSYLGNPMD